MKTFDWNLFYLASVRIQFLLINHWCHALVSRMHENNSMVVSRILFIKVIGKQFFVILWRTFNKSLECIKDFFLQCGFRFFKSYYRRFPLSNLSSDVRMGKEKVLFIWYPRTNIIKTYFFHFFLFFLWNCYSQ